MSCVQPLASLKALADPIYEAFYGLKEQPFAITTDPKFFYLSASHQRAFSELLNGLKRREGLLLLTGETGSGKTTLCRAVIEALGPRTFSAMVLNPYMSGAEVFRIILRDFGLVSHEELRRGALATADSPQLLDALEGFLRSLVSLDTFAVVIIDEAQSLAPQVLDQIRLLTALEFEGQRVAQIVLCGQPTLLTTLKAESMYALNERITRRVALAPLPDDEVKAYIDHRLGVAGGREAVSFSDAAAAVIGELSHGLPRRVNVLCDRALQEGRIEGASVITPELVKRGARALAGAHEAPSPLVVPSGPPPAATETVQASLTLGLQPPVTGRLRRFALAGLGGIVMAVLLGYGYYYSRLATNGVPLPGAPPAPERKIGVPLGALPVPTDDELRLLSEGVGTAETSAPLPDNRHQLD